MEIPKSFKRAIADIFYDKKIYVLSKKESMDCEGDYIVEKNENVYNFMGNVSFSNFKAIKEEYGLEYDIDIVITTSLDHKEKINLSTLILYDGKSSDIIDKFLKDSHVMFVVAVLKWK